MDLEEFTARLHQIALTKPSWVPKIRAVMADALAKCVDADGAQLELEPGADSNNTACEFNETDDVAANAEGHVAEVAAAEDSQDSCEECEAAPTAEDCHPAAEDSQDSCEDCEADNDEFAGNDPIEGSQPCLQEAVNLISIAALFQEAEEFYARADVNGDRSLSKSEIKKQLKKEPALKAKLVPTTWTEFFTELDVRGNIV